MEQFPEWSPFHSMTISSHQPLANIGQRYTCPQCHSSRRYYCYKCALVAPGVVLPTVRLPVRKVIVLKDERELDSKSTAVHAKMLCHDQVDLVSVKFDPRGNDPIPLPSSSGLSIILFPSEDAVQCDQVDWWEVDQVVVIEGTWSQGKAIERRLPGNVKRVVLPLHRKTAFWRYQQLGEHCLSTIEAIHALMQVIGAATGNHNTTDDLLWFYSHQYHLIQNHYKDTDRPFTHRHRPGYIQ